MKKLMVLLIILAMVNVASAGIVDIVISSLNGEPIEPTNEITIEPTDVINFDIVYYPGEMWTLFSLSTEVVVEGPGTLDITELTWPEGYWNMDFSNVTIIDDPSVGGVGNALMDLTASDIGVIGGGIVLDHFLMHCDEPGDVILYLVENGNTQAGFSTEVYDDIYPLEGYGPGVTVHQIPEPMTLTLLGLGGLVLLRKKK